MKERIMVHQTRLHQHEEIKNKKNNILTKKYKDMCKNPDFEQDYYSRTAIGLYEIEHDSIRLLKWLA